MERPAPHGETDLLLAPIKSAAADTEPVYAYLRRLRAAKSRREDGRLLYVAATRARQRLHLIGHANPDRRSGELRPAASSLLASLWPAVRHAYPAAAAATTAGAPAAAMGAETLRRLPVAWRPAPLAPPLAGASPGSPTETAVAEAIPFDWAGQTARHIGTLVHRWLERLAGDGLDAWSPERLDALTPQLRVGLANLGVDARELDAATLRCRDALANTLRDRRGRWILTAHPEHRSEYALTAVEDGQTRHFIIDRTFVDEQGVRWIIDYKTGMHGGGDLAAFLDQEQERYRMQLEGYGRLLQRLEDRPVRLGLYFPLVQGWREWTPDN